MEKGKILKFNKFVNESKNEEHITGLSSTTLFSMSDKFRNIDAKKSQEYYSLGFAKMQHEQEEKLKSGKYKYSLLNWLKELGFIIEYSKFPCSIGIGIMNSGDMWGGMYLWNNIDDLFMSNDVNVNDTYITKDNGLYYITFKLKDAMYKDNKTNKAKKVSYDTCYIPLKALKVTNKKDAIHNLNLFNEYYKDNNDLTYRNFLLQ